MKKYITGIILFSIPLFSSAEIKLVSEVLVGQSQHKLSSTLQENALFEKNSTSSKDNSFGFRIGLKLIDNLTLELAKHSHGSFDNELTVTDPRTGFREFAMKTNIKTSSIRYGVKGEVELYSGLSVNARIGIARWEDSQNYSRILEVLDYSNSEQSGDDLYYALGANFKLTENIYVGLEYSIVTINDRTYINDELIDSYKHDIDDFSLIIGWEF
jgi:opacity protein-like surface antigen